MIIEHNKSLVEYTTFGVDVTSTYFTEINTISELQELVTNELWKKIPHYILGGGSNILFTKNYEGLIVYNNLKGINIIDDSKDYTLVNVAAGEDWHDFVMWSVEQNLWGIENLALIPGTVGASPVQNIGAYGVEVNETIENVTVMNILSGEEETLTHAECNFGYRDSIFKQKSDTYFVLSVQFKLSKIPILNLEYGAIVDKLAEQNITNPSSLDMVQTIITIRQSKLPNVGEIGMAGSFFKNPITTIEHAQRLLGEYPEMKYFHLDDGSVKIPAGWIIETMGYKGVREGNVGTYDKHALVLVNHGGATGSEVWSFAQKIINDAYDTFKITLEPEVIIL